jgi:hypothetical protein
MREDRMGMMTADKWDDIRYFKPHEWGQWRSVSAELIEAVDKLRAALSAPCIIHCAYATDGHSQGSLHYRGLAVDLHFRGVSLLDQVLAAERIGLFGGIGAYPHWANRGLHLDVGLLGRRWIRDKHGVYVALNEANLRAGGALP